MLTIIFKTGETQNKDGKQFKSKRKNAKLESDKLCPQNSDEDKKLYSQVTDNTVSLFFTSISDFKVVSTFTFSSERYSFSEEISVYFSL